MSLLTFHTLLHSTGVVRSLCADPQPHRLPKSAQKVREDHQGPLLLSFSLPSSSSPANTSDRIMLTLDYSRDADIGLCAQIPLQQPYMKERVELSAFASDETVQALLKDMEDQFAARFSACALSSSRPVFLCCTLHRRYHHHSPLYVICAIILTCHLVDLCLCSPRRQEEGVVSPARGGIAENASF